MGKTKAGIIGPGNIGTDLMFKILRSPVLEMKLMCGIVDSEGIHRAKGIGVPTSLDGVDAVAFDDEIEIVFDATSATEHLKHAPLLRERGKIVFDMTPAAVGDYVVPCVNLDRLGLIPNYNMVTCGGQATIPIVYAIDSAVNAVYAEIVSCIASKSAGPGTRANIDEFTQTTARGLKLLGGADRTKAIIILNPADPPLLMTSTIYTIVDEPDETKIKADVMAMVERIQAYVPGYRLKVPPIVDGNRVTVTIEVEGAGDFLPKYAGNLDIINAAAVAAAEHVAKTLKEGTAV